jgi:ABC-type polysaccharide/polyol phosphate export permease
MPKVQCLVCETRYINILSHMMDMMRYPYINNAVPKVTPWPKILLNKKSHADCPI